MDAFKISFDIKLNGEWVARGETFASKVVVAFDGQAACEHLKKLELATTYPHERMGKTMRPDAFRVLAVERIARDVLVGAG